MSTCYWYYVEELHAVKVGRGTPTERMRDYCSRHRLNGSKLHHHRFSPVIDTIAIEQRLHELLESMGLVRITRARGKRQSIELFALGQHAFDIIARRLHRECIAIERKPPPEPKPVQLVTPPAPRQPPSLPPGFGTPNWRSLLGRVATPDELREERIQAYSARWWRYFQLTDWGWLNNRAMVHTPGPSLGLSTSPENVAFIAKMKVKFDALSKEDRRVLDKRYGYCRWFVPPKEVCEATIRRLALQEMANE